MLWFCFRQFAMLSAIISIVSLIFLKELAEAEILAVEIGSTVLLPCESTNLNTTFWANRLKGRELLSTDDKLESYNPRFNVYFQYNLQIGISQVEDAGEYSCILKLDQSEQKINYKLEIVDSLDNATGENYLPSYYYSRVKAVINETVILPCEVIHYTNSNWIGWEKNGEVILKKSRKMNLNFKSSDIKAVEGFILEIQNVQPEDSDVEYVCRIENNAEITFKLEINDDYDYIDSCSPSPCGLNSECHPSKDDSPFCNCRKNYKGEPPKCIPDCKENCTPYLACLSERCVEVYEMSCGVNAECVVQDYKYTCACEDRYFGNPYIGCYNTSSFFQPNETIPVQNHEVSVNSNAILECESDEFDSFNNFIELEKKPANASLRYKINLHESRIQIYTQYNLLITRVQPTDGGEYTCKILKGKPAYNLTYKLEIIDPSDTETSTTKPGKPYFAIIRANVGDSVILPCEGVNLNFRHLKWEAHVPQDPELPLEIPNLRLNSPTSRLKILRGENLEIQNLQAEDAGTYSCYTKSSTQKQQIISHVLKISDYSLGNKFDPCARFPCGANSECYTNKNKPVCSCRRNYIGIPPFCIKNCIHDIDCFSIACVSEKCKVLCEQSCGPDAACIVQNFTYTCMCGSSFGNISGKCLSESSEDKCGGIPCSVISICGPFAFLLLVVGTIMFLISKSRHGNEFQQNNQNVKTIGQENEAYNSLPRATNQYSSANEKYEPRKHELTLKIPVTEG